MATGGQASSLILDHTSVQWSLRPTDLGTSRRPGRIDGPMTLIGDLFVGFPPFFGNKSKSYGNKQRLKEFFWEGVCFKKLIWWWKTILWILSAVAAFL